MSFVDPIKTSRRKTPGVTAAVIGVGRDGASLRLQLRFVWGMGDKIGGSCDVLLGDDEDSGSVLLRFRDGGAHDVRRTETKSTRKTFVLIPPPPCVPHGYTLGATQCEWSWGEKKTLGLPLEMIVRLPLEKWRADVVKFEKESGGGTADQDIRGGQEEAR